MYFIFEILGTVAFAISGAMVAVEKKMDMLGVVILGVTTAVGGGIIRDLLVGQIPPKSLDNPLYALVAIGVSLIIFLPPIRKRVDVNNAVLNVIDAIGLGTFTVIGTESGLKFDNVFLQVFLGVLTGVGGGVLRDLFANEKPMIFVHRFYAVASFLGASVCVALYPFQKNAALIAGIVLVVVLRICAAKFKWHLPKA